MSQDKINRILLYMIVASILGPPSMAWPVDGSAPRQRRSRKDAQRLLAGFLAGEAPGRGTLLKQAALNQSSIAPH